MDIVGIQRSEGAGESICPTAYIVLEKEIADAQLALAPWEKNLQSTVLPSKSGSLPNQPRALRQPGSATEFNQVDRDYWKDWAFEKLLTVQWLWDDAKVAPETQERAKRLTAVCNLIVEFYGYSERGDADMANAKLGAISSEFKEINRMCAKNKGS